MVTSWNPEFYLTTLDPSASIISPSWMCLLDIKSLQRSAGFLQELLCLALLHDHGLELLVIHQTAGVKQKKKNDGLAKNREGQGHNFPLLFSLHQASLALENMTNLERFETRINSHLIQEENSTSANSSSPNYCWSQPNQVAGLLDDPCKRFPLLHWCMILDLVSICISTVYREWQSVLVFLLAVLTSYLGLLIHLSHLQRIKKKAQQWKSNLWWYFCEEIDVMILMIFVKLLTGEKFQNLAVNMDDSKNRTVTS